MATPTPVVVVEPARSKEAKVVQYSSGVLSLAATAWMLMLLTPVAFPYYPSYWQAFAILLIARFLQKNALPPKIEDLSTTNERPF